MGRDNFTKSTIDVLGKRVGYICSNPSCKNSTVGPHTVPEKAAIIGVAAHISAASPGGPRYDNSLNTEQRSHISNGIWLCNNCSTLIDKDEEQFPVELLKKWKEEAEGEMRNAIYGSLSIDKIKDFNPFIEADLIYSHGMRLNRGYSYEKNRDKFGGNAIPVGGKPIIFWEITWSFSFVFHNNSSYPAFNLKVDEISDIRFSNLTTLPKINNLPPYQSIDLRAEWSQFLEGEHTEADKLLKQKIPEALNGLELKISYRDENQQQHITHVKIENQEISNLKVDRAVKVSHLGRIKVSSVNEVLKVDSFVV